MTSSKCGPQWVQEQPDGKFKCMGCGASFDQDWLNRRKREMTPEQFAEWDAQRLTNTST